MGRCWAIYQVHNDLDYFKMVNDHIGKILFSEIKCKSLQKV